MPTTDQITMSNIHYVKPEQVEAMRDAAYRGSFGDRDDAIVTVLYDTGLRRAELGAVNQDMVDLDAEELRIPSRIQKDFPNDNSPKPATFRLDPSGELRTVRTLRSYFDSRNDDSPALFPSRKADRMTGKGLNEVVKRLAREAEIRPYHQEGRGGPGDVTAHTFRHSVAWRMLRAEEGNTIYDVRNRLRHSRVSTTEDRYDHFQRI